MSEECSDCIEIRKSGKDYCTCEHCGHLYYEGDECECGESQSE